MKVSYQWRMWGIAFLAVLLGSMVAQEAQALGRWRRGNNCCCQTNCCNVGYSSYYGYGNGYCGTGTYGGYGYRNNCCGYVTTCGYGGNYGGGVYYGNNNGYYGAVIVQPSYDGRSGVIADSNAIRNDENSTARATGKGQNRGPVNQTALADGQRDPENGSARTGPSSQSSSQRMVTPEESNPTQTTSSTQEEDVREQSSDARDTDET